MTATEHDHPVLRTCPKCSAVVRNQTECRKCGLLFEKYFQAEKKRSAEEQQRLSRSARRRYLLKLSGLFIGVLLFLSVSVFALIAYHEPIITGSIRAAHGVHGWLTQGEEERFHNPSDKSFIDHARQATVSIRTPLGSGSGFFVSPTHVVTNKHVVDINFDFFYSFKHRVEKVQKILELEAEKIKEMRKKWRQMKKGPTRTKLKLELEQREENYQRALENQRKNEDRLSDLEAKIDSPVISVILYDGTEYQATYIEKSPEHDLALIHLFGIDNTYLEPAPESESLQQGDTVYTVGSPAGLRNTVTAGIFSGYRWQSSNMYYLQTDAPINPGNSGGPLIDRFGQVLGVNTWRIRHSDGLGFSIPVGLVFDDFESSLRRKHN